MMIVSKIIRIIGPVFVVCITFLLLPLPLQASGLRTDLHTDLLIVKGPLLRAESAVYYAVYYNERNQESVDEAEEEYEEEDDDQQIWVHYGIYFIILFFVTIIRDAKSTKPTPSAVDIVALLSPAPVHDPYPTRVPLIVLDTTAALLPSRTFLKL